VVVGVMLARLFGMMRGMIQMTFGDVRVVAGLLVVTRLMMLGGGQMMLRGMLVVLGCLAVVVCGFFRHGDFSF
jgi:hypothetical protein